MKKYVEGKSNVSSIIIIVLGIFLYKVFLSEKPSNQNKQYKPPTNTQNDFAVKPEIFDDILKVDQTNFALRTTANNWPTVSEDNIDVADDLLAANYYFVFDGSGSMTKKRCSGDQTKLGVAKDALVSFASSIPKQANIGLLTFDSAGTSERVALGQNNVNQFSQQVQQTVANGGTPLRVSIQKAYAALKQQGKRQLGYGEYHLVIVTDGIASKGQDPTDTIGAILKESPVVIHTIGFCINDKHSLNQPGLTYYKSANDPSSLRASLDEVLAESPEFVIDSFPGNN